MKRFSQLVGIFALGIAVVVTPLSAEICHVAKDGQSGWAAITTSRPCLPRTMCCPSTIISSGVECVGPQGAVVGFVRLSIEPGSMAFGHSSLPKRTSLNPRDLTFSASGLGLEGSPGSFPPAFLCDFRL